jgi:glycosyltransferase involved in cell wall biosynthesis
MAVQVSSFPTVTVIVPVRNGADTLRDCLVSLSKTDYPRDRREIVVVDNGSTDATAAIIAGFPEVRRVVEPMPGASRARNRGIQSSDGEILAFTDADCLATAGWLSELVGAFTSPAIGGAAGEILGHLPRTRAERDAARRRHLSPRRYLQRPLLPFAVTANLAFRRSIFDRVGLFDPTSPRGGESTDFCTRFFRETGLTLAFAPKAVVFHRHRSTTWSLFDQHWSYGRGHAFLYVKYRREIPWGWRQTLQVYRDLAATGGRLAVAAARRAAGRVSADDFDTVYFDFVRKVAMRLGFAREALARGHLYF